MGYGVTAEAMIRTISALYPSGSYVRSHVGYDITVVPTVEAMWAITVETLIEAIWDIVSQ